MRCVRDGPGPREATQTQLSSAFTIMCMMIHFHRIRRTAELLDLLVHIVDEDVDETEIWAHNGHDAVRMVADWKIDSVTDATASYQGVQAGADF